MSRKNTIFTQIAHLLEQHNFRTIVNKYQGDKYVKTMDCWQQLLIMLYAQIKGLDNLREIETSLKAHADKWSHIGLQSVARSTFSDANRDRPCKIFEDLFFEFLSRCERLAPRHNFRIDMPVFSYDSTLINLCLASFPWARYRTRKGAMKLHTLIDHDGYLPSFITMSDGRCHDLRMAKDPIFGFPALPPDSILTVDRGYIDYCWLHSLHTQGVTFIVMAKTNMVYEVIGQHKPTLEKRGILSDEIIELTTDKGSAYPERLRLITYYDKEEDKYFTFMTNNFALAATTIASLYKGRWQIEEFFRWIKQHLKIKTFLGTSENAVMIQVWTAMILYLLLSFIKFQSRYEFTLLELLRVIKEILFDRYHLIEILRVNYERLKSMRESSMQMAFL